MILLNKGNEPAAWSAKCTTPGFTTYSPIPELRQALIADQFGICAFCMRRIPIKDQTEKETSKIAHLLSRTNHPNLQLKYDNMVAACPGMINGTPHCDKSQESNDITLPLFRGSLQDSISYGSKDGAIKSSEPAWDAEIQIILNLNNELLKRNRWETLEGIRRVMDRKAWKLAQLKVLLQAWEYPDQNGLLKPYCGIVTWYLRKKIRLAESQI